MVASYTIKQLLDGRTSQVSPMQVRRLLKKAGVKDAYERGEPEILPGAALLVWLAAVLEGRAPIDRDARETLLDFLAEKVVEAGTTVAAALEDSAPLPAVTLTIVDGTMVGMSGMDCWLDLRSGFTTKELPQAPFEAVSYNLTTLYVLHTARLKAENEREAGRAERCRVNSIQSTGG